MNNRLAVKLEENSLSDEHKKKVLEAFGAPFEEAGEILKDYIDEDRNLVITDKSIKVTSEDDIAAMAEAREKRLTLMRVRTGVEKKRKELGEGYYKTYKAINDIATYIKDPIKPVEDYLESQEKFAEIKAAERAAKLKAERLERLAQFTDDTSMYNFESMNDEQFDSLITTLKAQKDAELAAAKKAEEERLEAIEAEKKRQAEIEAENARLKKEAEEREKAVAAERAKLQAETEKREAAERAERERIQAENEKKLAAERAMADEERKKREALEAERRASDAEEARKKAAVEEAERQALLAPDKEKIVAFANALSVLRSQAPTVKSQEAQELLNSVDTAIAGFVEKILVKAKSL